MSISVGGRLLLVKAGSLAQKRTLQNRESEARRVLEAKKIKLEEEMMHIAQPGSAHTPPCT